MRPIAIAAVVLMYASQVWVGYLVFTRKVRWRGRDLFELAAQSVEVAEGSYTSRPRPAGRVEATQRELLDFASFVQRNLIALAYIEDQRIVFRPVLDSSPTDLKLYWRSSAMDGSWIAFEFDGAVSVCISRQDYLQFVEDLSFDQLCASLGQVFIEFLALYRRGESVRILDRLNAMPVGIFG